MLATPAEDVPGALAAVAERLGATRSPAWPDPPAPSVPADGPLNADAIGKVVGATLPEAAVIVDESITAGVGLVAGTAGAALTIGSGTPAAPSARASRSLPARRWRDRGGGSCAWRRTAAPCTPSRRSGPRLGKAWT